MNLMKWLAALLALTLLCPLAAAEVPTVEGAEAPGPVREYANWLEEVLPGASFADAEVPTFCEEYLGGDYDLLARTDARYGTYVACTRKEGAPPLPKDVTSEEDSQFSSQSFQRIWTLTGGGETIYRFILGEDVELYDFDGGAHLIVTLLDEAAQPFAHPSVAVWEAADAARRRRLIYMCEAGFEPRAGGYSEMAWVQERAQLAVEVHSIETWRAGVTDEPTLFYLDAEDLPPLTTERSVPREHDGRDYFELAIPIGLHYEPAGRDAPSLDFVLAPDGTKGVRDVENQCIWEAGPGFNAALDRVEAILGYRPGDANFSGKTSVRATLEWGAGDPSDTGGKAGSKTVEDAATLRKLDALLNAADLGQGGYNCPSPCFLTLEYEDGSAASLAVAINSYDYFFYRGLGIQAEGEILPLFGLSWEDVSG